MGKRKKGRKKGSRAPKAASTTSNATASFSSSPNSVPAHASPHDPFALLKELISTPFSKLSVQELMDRVISNAFAFFDATKFMETPEIFWKNDERVGELVDLLRRYVEEADDVCGWDVLAAELEEIKLDPKDEADFQRFFNVLILENSNWFKSHFGFAKHLERFRECLVQVVWQSRSTTLGDEKIHCLRCVLVRGVTLTSLAQLSNEDFHYDDLSQDVKITNMIDEARELYHDALKTYAYSLSLAGDQDILAESLLRSALSRSPTLPFLLQLKSHLSRVLRRLGKKTAAKKIEEQVLNYFHRYPVTFTPALLRQFFLLPEGQPNILLDKLNSRKVFEKAENPSTKSMIKAEFFCDNDCCPLEFEEIPPLKSTLLKCGTCSVTFYCSKACQKAGWNRHKSVCKQIVAFPLSLRFHDLIRWALFLKPLLYQVFPSALDLFAKPARCRTHCLIVTLQWIPSQPMEERFEVVDAQVSTISYLQEQPWINQENLKTRLAKSTGFDGHRGGLTVVRSSDQPKEDYLFNVDVATLQLDKRAFDQDWWEALKRRRPPVSYKFGVVGEVRNFWW